MSIFSKALRTVSIPWRGFKLFLEYALTSSPESNRHMIVVSGFFDVIPSVTWAMLKWAFSSRLGITMHIVKPPRQGRAGLEETANLVIARMYEIMHLHGAERVSLAGHSWGGIVIREVMRRLEESNQDDVIEAVLRFAPPDEGTLAANYGRFVPVIGQYLYLTSPSMRMMCYKSPEIVGLASFENGRVAEHVYASKNDGLFCSPWTTGTAARGAQIHLATMNEDDLKLVPGARQVRTAVGHLLILTDDEIMKDAVESLAAP